MFWKIMINVFLRNFGCNIMQNLKWIFPMDCNEFSIIGRLRCYITKKLQFYHRKLWLSDFIPWVVLSTITGDTTSMRRMSQRSLWSTYYTSLSLHDNEIVLPWMNIFLAILICPYYSSEFDHFPISIIDNTVEYCIFCKIIS